MAETRFRGYSYGSYGMEAHYFTFAKDIHQLRGDLTLEASCSSFNARVSTLNSAHWGFFKWGFSSHHEFQ